MEDSQVEDIAFGGEKERNRSEMLGSDGFWGDIV
jgi:hypothetical protein